MALIVINTVSSGVIKEGITIETNTLKANFGEVSRAFIPVHSVSKILVRGEGASEMVNIRYVDGESDSLNYTQVDTADGEAITSNAELFDFLKNIFIST